MSRKQLASEMTTAMDAASRQALRDSIGNLPADTTLGSLLNDLGSSRPGSMLRSMPLSELATLLPASNGAAPTNGHAEVKTRKAKRAKRTDPTTAVRAYLRKTGKARAEEIRANVGGTPAGVRQALFELKDERLVRRTGKGRATTWHWRG